jgi:hypothetical protein
MISHFEKHILSYISPYFFPLRVYIRDFWKTMVPEREKIASKGEEVVHSTATVHDIINVFKAALRDEDLINAARKSSTVLGKRSAPGDLVTGLTGWDPVKVHRISRAASPKLSPRPTRKAKFMAKR